MDNKYIYFSKEQIEMANDINLEEFLKTKGEVLINSGKDKRLKSDNSITIRKNKWFDHSKKIGGYPIEFIKYFYSVDFITAMSELLNNTSIQIAHYENEIENKEFKLPPRNDNMYRVFSYITKHRGISSSVLKFFVDRNLIYESKEIAKKSKKEYHNIIFVGLNHNKKPCHGYKRSINSTGKRFVQNIVNSKSENSFNYLGGSNKIYVFESPIDLLSFITLEKDKNWTKHNYLSLCGTSIIPLLEILKHNKNINHIMLCLDNDKTGRETCERFKNQLADRNLIVTNKLPVNKDYNEDLVKSKSEVQ